MPAPESNLCGAGQLRKTLDAFVARHLGYGCALLYFVKSEILGLRLGGHMDVGIQQSFGGEYSGTYWLNDAGDSAQVYPV